MQKKTYTADYLTHAKRKNDGAEEFVIQKDHHPAIISRQLFLEAQARLSEKKRAPEEMKKYRNRYWCSGKVRCGCCGSTCVSRVRRRRDGSISQSWLCAECGRIRKKKIGLCRKARGGSGAVSGLSRGGRKKRCASGWQERCCGVKKYHHRGK